MADAASGYLVARLDGSYGDVHPLAAEARYTLGRAPTNRIPLRDDMCSREHAEVYWFNNAWHVRDLKSLNGTFVNEEKLARERKLHAEDQVRFGNSRFLFLHDLTDLPTHQPDPGPVTDITIKTRLDDTKYISPKKSVGLAPTAEFPAKARHVSQDEAVALLFRLATDTATAATPTELAEMALNTLFHGTTAEVAAVLAVPGGRDSELIAYRTRNASQKTYHKVSSFVSHEVAKTQQAVLAEDVAAEKKLKDRDSVSELKAASLICAPVAADDELLGLIHIYSTTASRRLNADDLELTLAIARQVGIAWQRLRREAGLTAEVKALKDRFHLESGLVGGSGGIKAIETQVARVAPTKATVLIRGESGVGKELVARAVHQSGPRKSGAFVCLNCAALTETLLESELFGHEKGSFTGATERLIGKFESADGGTIFLDEIGEMTLGTQAKLLRVLEGQPFERVGGNTPIHVDVRVVAATNRPLEDAVREGTFRKDLFFRLQVVQIDVPPLRDRPDDIPPLALHFFQYYTRETGRRLKGFSPASMKKLTAYHWPGNVRELRNAIERAVVLCGGSTLEDSDIWLSPLETGPRESTDVYSPKTLDEVEKRHIEQTLTHTGWNKSQSADILGIERSTLDRKIKSYGLKK
ncbi:sigma 54-interacting transcriptional regulator [Limnoglobus roseus]|uniref:Sigma-54-dependent Fis family transcriptional regulator n=1 Tax=Limnoglobus roseus TaxID=2598579 RepID=A0A5C1AB30_9BACT|nr:sigma 54-interacting transcriptional regulator [Limnoglobus roseus]QEL15022.1 sigma-54-dependent Fis family transcriptional regulator [Limnoglobus roseus]